MLKPGIKILKELVNLIEMVSFIADIMELYYQHQLLINVLKGLQFCGIKSSSVPAERR